MCEPSTIMMGVSLAATAVGTLVSAQQQQQQGKALAQQAQYRAQVAQNNQVLAERAAQDALQRGGVEEARSRMETARLAGRQRAALAASGQVVGEGSALSIITDTKGLGELDAQTVRSNAEREALGFRIKGMDFEAESALSMASGRQSLADARFGATGTLLSGAGTVANRWYNFAS